MRTGSARRRPSHLGVRAVALTLGAAVVASLAGPAVGASAASGHTTRAARLVAASFAASQAASSVTVNGTIANGKQSIVLHVTDTKSGDGYGTVKVQGQTIHVVQVGPVNYFKAGTGFWGKVLGSKTALAVALYANHWVKSSGSNSPGAGFSQFVNMSTFLGGFDTRNVHWVIAGRSRLHGQPVTVLRGTQRRITGRLLIAAKGPPYLMAIEPPHGQGRIMFSNWDKAVHVRAPTQWVPFNSPAGTASP